MKILVAPATDIYRVVLGRQFCLRKRKGGTMSYVNLVRDIEFRRMSDAPRDGTFIYLYLANQTGRYLATWDAGHNVWRGETFTLPATLPIAWSIVPDPE